MPSVLRMATVVAAGGTAAAAYVFTDTKFQLFGMSLGGVRMFDPETAHKLTIQAAKYGMLPSDIRKDDPRLHVHLWGRKFTNPIGVAAGFDKDAEAMDSILNMGVGFMEVGSIPPKPQPGNDKPRVFRLPLQNAVINRMGFNSKGIDDAEPRLQQYQQRRLDGTSDASKILMVNLGKNKETEDGAADFEQGVQKLLPYADAVVINVSSPNTPGLRGLQSKSELATLIKRVRAAMAKAIPPHDPKVNAPKHPLAPLLVKIAPDLSPQERADIAAVATARGTRVDGLVVSNTTVTRPYVMHGERHAKEAGGLSGAPLMGPSTETLADMYRRTRGEIPLIGCGGVMSGGDAYLKIRAGASLVELYTGLVYKGPELIPSLKQELLRCLEADGFSCVEDAVGADHDQLF